MVVGQIGFYHSVYCLLYTLYNLKKHKISSLGDLFLFTTGYTGKFALCKLCGELIILRFLYV